MDTPLAEWHFQFQVDIPEDIYPVLASSEQPVCAFKTFRDSAVFTTKRLVVRDVQGMTGHKVEMYSLPYSSILMWSSENAGMLHDISAEMTLWTKLGNFKISLGRKVDVRAIDQLLASSVFGD